MKKHSSGFALIEGILILLIVVILGGTIYYVYKSNQNTSESLKNVGSGEIATPKKAQTTSTSPASTQNYVTIKQWGVKIRMKDAGKVAYNYSAKADTGLAGEYESSVGFTIKSEFIKNPDCEDPGAGFFRSKQKPEGSPKKIGDYYYWVEGAPGACTDNPQSDPDDLLKQSVLQDINTENLQAL